MDSHTTTQILPETVKHQLVLDQLEMDPGRHQGPALIKGGIQMHTGINLTCAFVEEETHLQDPKGFTLCDPTLQRIKRRALVNIGIHEEWSMDGHDKIKRIGFAIYGVCDVWSGKWLGLWVITDNRLKDAVAYLWLSLVEEYGSLPIQTTTDCGLETTMIYGLATALWEAFFPEFPVNEIPAHCFLRSIHSITIERGWSQLKFQFDANVDEFWDRGIIEGIYDAYDEQHIALACSLWSILIQKEITTWKDRFNSHKPQCDRQKFNQSGVQLDVAFALPEKHGGINCL
ncbi:hypothetical protein M422DRAFT_264157 [Sphaerobolus stellatus SS14]|uniref:Integrase core domain-containing protein n=1 Tax=Sphaerobolus stellatus (strain SS14) TaxID=990650 RepID=A0A0C9V8U0_SPHS4|nr:hypothetical protein M422DRAFT_264157 [Sphaerobolus stellatus SS14]